MKSLRYIAALSVSALLLSGCATTHLGSNVSESTDLDSFKTFYVQKLAEDDRGIEQVIADELNKRGFLAIAGGADTRPDDVDILVTYQDRWMWDMTMYMIEINIEFRDPQNSVVVADGTSYRTSFARKPPEFMVNEVLTDIFNN